MTTTPLAGRWRAVRTSAVASAVVAVATGAHVAAGGTVSSWRAVGLACLLVVAGSALVTAARLTAPRVVAWLAVGQVVVHHALAWVPGRHCPGGVQGTAGEVLFVSQTPVPCTTPAVAEHGHALWSDPVMLLAHAAATLATALLLAGADEVLWLVVAALGLPAVRLPGSPLPLDAGPVVPAPRSVDVPTKPALAGCDPVRGPPGPPASTPA